MTLCIAARDALARVSAAAALFTARLMVLLLRATNDDGMLSAVSFGDDLDRAPPIVDVDVVALTLLTTIPTACPALAVRWRPHAWSAGIAG